MYSGWVRNSTQSMCTSWFAKSLNSKTWKAMKVMPMMAVDAIQMRKPLMLPLVSAE